MVDTNASLEKAPLPWKQETELSIVRDGRNQPVSFLENAARIVRAVNFEMPAIVCLERMVATVKRATGPAGSSQDTAALIAQAALANALVRVARGQQ